MDPKLYNIEKVVNKVLLDYEHSKGMDCNAGYDVMRYAEEGYLKVTVDATAEFMSWYPLNAAYIILRLVKRGFVTYQPQEVKNAIPSK